ncbi:MAG: hypothetical protein ACK5RG_22240 [Cyclobacteriaceae bacterium]|nr:hypothetical protein [Flammeovirgaceae bacterium]
MADLLVPLKMRKELKNREGVRKKYKAQFERIGKKINYKGYSEDTILLKNVVDIETTTRVADHIWFSYTQGFSKAQLQPGDTIEFEARSKAYTKGYVNRALKISDKRSDYKLSNPTKIRKVS